VLLSVRALIGEVELRLVAIPGVAEARYVLDFAFCVDVVGRWNEEQPEGPNRSACASDERQRETGERERRSWRKPAEP
jgi:hypothetical protein